VHYDTKLMISAHELCSTLPLFAITKLLANILEKFRISLQVVLKNYSRLVGSRRLPTPVTMTPGPPAKAETRSKVK
jgi:hypothetical protein